MIKIIVGGVGSGKTISAVKEILKTPHLVFSNIGVNCQNHKRLMIEHIVHDVVIGQKQNGEPILKKQVNWDFWNDLIEKKQYFSIVIDEVHNILNARRAMSSWNVLFSTWLTQIRKILGDNRDCHLWLIAQRLSSIDIVARELSTDIIYCQKIILKNIMLNCKIKENGRLKFKKLPKTIIKKFLFSGEQAEAKYISYKMYGAKSYNSISAFTANPFFRFYDSYSIIKFGDGVYL